MANGIQAGLGSLKNFMVSSIKDSMNLAAAFEQTSISFKVLLGDADKAKSMLAGMREIDASSPLDFGDLTEAGKTMLAFGMNAESVLPSLRQLGDIAMGNGERFKSLALAFSQTQAAGRLMGGEVLQFVQAGFNPLLEISRKTGESMIELKKRLEAGGISAAEVANAFKSATSEGGLFFGGMEQGAQSFEGKMAKLTGTIKAGMIDMGTGINNALKPVIEDITAEMGKMGPLATQAGVAIGAWATELYKSAGGMQGILQSTVEIAARIADWTVPFIVFKDLVVAGFKIINTSATALGALLGTGFAQAQAAFELLAALVKVKVQSMKNDWIELGYQIELAFTRALNKIKEGINSVSTTMKAAMKSLNPKQDEYNKALSSAVRKNRDKYAPGKALPPGVDPMEPMPDGQGSIDGTLLGMSPEPVKPDAMPLDWAGIGEAQEKFRVVNEEAMKADVETAKQAFTDLTEASGDAYEALSDPFGGGPSPGDIIKAEYEKANKAAAVTQTKSVANSVATVALAQNTALQTGAVEAKSAAESIASADTVRTAKIRAALDAASEIQRANDQVAEQFKSQNRDMVGDMVTSWATGTGKISDIVGQWANRMIEQFIQLSLFGAGGKGGLMGSVVGGLTGGGGWASTIGTVLGGFFAEGGRPPMGKVSVVGERGPELFVPDSAGTVIPNHKAFSGGGGVSGKSGGGGEMAPPIIINQSFSNGVTRAELAGSMDDMMEQTKGAVMEGVRRGGSYRRGLQS